MTEGMKFQSKIVEIEALQWDGSLAEATLIIAWVLEQGGTASWREAGDEWPEARLRIETLEGTMTAGPSDWIIKGLEGEFYPCKDSVFKAKYASKFDIEIDFHQEVMNERMRQVQKGYGAVNDARKGVGRLIRMAYDFNIQGQHVKAAAMEMAALAVITAVVQASDGQATEVKI